MKTKLVNFRKKCNEKFVFAMTHAINFFHTQEVYVFRYMDSKAKLKDRRCKTLEEARSLKFRHVMNNGGDYQILRAVEDSMFKRILKIELRFLRFKVAIYKLLAFAGIVSILAYGAGIIIGARGVSF